MLIVERKFDKFFVLSKFCFRQDFLFSKRISKVNGYVKFIKYIIEKASEMPDNKAEQNCAAKAYLAYVEQAILATTQ